MVNNWTVYNEELEDYPNKENYLIALTAHEIFHSYFPFYMGINESKYAWMDEGWASFEDYAITNKLISNSAATRWDPDNHLLYDNVYKEIIGSELDLPMLSISKMTKRPTYSVNSYAKPALAVRRVRKLGATEEVYHALVLGTRDYMGKNGFTKAVIALSGGIDSALTTAIATAAIGEENVVGVSMPSPYSSRGSIDDSKALARNLGIRIISLPIREAMQAYDKILKKPFEGLPLDITEENMQARIRGTLMMALSNKMGWLVLTTGNKSEVSVGYCTLYGDMAGGFAVIKDVPKIWVYQLSRWINKDAGRELIPKATITKEPSAELRPDQKDTDSLPPYSLLDKVLARYIEEDRGIEELKGMGLSMKEVKRIVKMVDASEYKRRQGPPGIKITPKAFGKDRRLPITNRYEP